MHIIHKIIVDFSIFIDYNLQIVTSYAHKTLGVGSIDVSFEISSTGCSISFGAGIGTKFEEGSPAYNSVLVE